MAKLDTIDIGETSRKCSRPASTIKCVDLRAGNCEGSAIRILKALLSVNTELEVTRLECWSRTTFRPLEMPAAVNVVSTPGSWLPSSCISSTRSEYLVFFKANFILKLQHIPESVGTGLNSLEQLTSLPAQEQLFSRKPGETSDMLKQGRLEWRMRRNKFG